MEKDTYTQYILILITRDISSVTHESELTLQYITATHAYCTTKGTAFVVIMTLYEFTLQFDTNSHYITASYTYNQKHSICSDHDFALTLQFDIH